MSKEANAAANTHLDPAPISTPTSSQPLLHGDRAVQHPHNDRLGVAPLAKHIANGIVRMAPPEGLVIGLYAPWGAGKSTVLHFVEHYVREDFREDEHPVIVRFNPWWFADQSDIINKFFLQLELSLRQDNIGGVERQSEELTNDLDQLSKAVGVFSVSEGDVVRADVRKPITGAIPFLKQQIAEKLQRDGRRILVIIDDVDRLATAAEVRQVFQAIKAIADFPGTVYLLAFDREAVTGALDAERGTAGFGADYLEKIVQVSFELPMPDRADVDRLLFERLDAALAATPESDFSQDAWGDMYYQGIRSFVQTPRDAVRFANTVHITYAAVRGEVNPVDFLAIEALRVFAPVAYNIVRQNQDRFAGNTESGVYGRDLRAELKKFHEGWMERLILPDQHEAISNLLSKLFPKFKYVLMNSGYGADWEASWRRNLKACSSDIFPTYFRLSISPGSLPRSVVQDLLESAGNSEVFASKLRDLSAQKITSGAVSPVRKALQRLLDHTDGDIKQDQVGPILTALFDLADDLVRNEPKVQGMYDFGISMDIGRMFFFTIRLLPEPDRFALLKDICENGKAVEFVLSEVAVLGQEHGKLGGDPDPYKQPVVTIEHLGVLEQICVERIRRLAASGELLDTQSPIGILYRWKEWGVEGETEEWVRQVAIDDDVLLTLLERSLGYTKSNALGSVVVHRNPSLSPKSLEPFLPADTTIDRVRVLASRDDLTEIQHVATNQYVKEYVTSARQQSE